MVGEHSLGSEASPGGHWWSVGKRVCRNEYAINRVRISVTESLRVPEPEFDEERGGGAVAWPKGVGDGKQVNIPVPAYVRLTLRGDAGVTGPSGGGLSDARW